MPQPPLFSLLLCTAVRMLFTVIRDKGTANPEYVRYADRLMTLLAEEGLARISVKKVQVTTPCGLYEGIKGPDPEDMCVVSIPRSGDILMEAGKRPWCLCTKGTVVVDLFLLNVDRQHF